MVELLGGLRAVAQVEGSGRGAQAQQARRQRSQHGPAALLALFVPAVLFPLGLFLLRGDPRFAWLASPPDYPWELWAIALCGVMATFGGVGDWLFHRSGATVVGAGEHRAHLAALVGGGIPLFVLMVFASLSPRPVRFLLPVLIVLIATVVLICYDEFVFHRRCGRFEALTHRLLTFGNGLAFLAWAHWCFVRGGIHG